MPARKKAKAAWKTPEWALTEEAFKAHEAEVSKSLEAERNAGFSEGASTVKLRQVRGAGEVAEKIIAYLLVTGAAEFRLLLLSALEDLDRRPEIPEPCQPWMHAEPWECKIHKPETKEAPRL